MLTPTYRESNAFGMLTFVPMVNVHNEYKYSLHIDCLTKKDAIHNAEIEIKLLESISKYPDSQF